MAFVTVDNINVEVDYLGYVVGTKLTTELTTSLGIVECTFRKVVLSNHIVVEADLYRGGMNLLSKITLFRARVFIRLEGREYRIIDNRRRYANDYWRELETLISNTILANE